MRDSSSAQDHPKFKLRFNVTKSESGFASSSFDVIREESGVTSISFPKGNAQNYSPMSLFQAVIAPSNGKPFALTLRQMDIPSHPANCKGWLYVYFIKEIPTDTQYEKQPSSVVRICGQVGNISELIGQTSVAIVRFNSGRSEETGRGFRLEADISKISE